MSNLNSLPVSGSPVKGSNTQRALNDLENKPKALETRKLQALDMAGKFAGPMPLDAFLNRFLPAPQSEEAFLEKSPGSFDFSAICDDFEEKSRVKKKNVIPNLVDASESLMGKRRKLVDTQHKQNRSTSDDPYQSLRADASGYDFDVDTSEPGLANRHDHMLWWLELKPNHLDDPFDDKAGGKERPFEAEGDQRTLARGQACAIFDIIMAKQHRTFILSGWLEEGGYARLICWNRSVVVVTERFQFNVPKSPLARFFYRLGQATSTGIGLDTTISTPTQSEVLEAARAFDHFGEHPTIYDRDEDEPQPKPDSKVSDDKLATEAYVAIKVPAAEGKETRRVIAKKDRVIQLQSGIGRGTRCFPVYDPVTKRVCRLKDTWRAVELPKEWEFLEHLKKCEVQNVPTYLGGGEIHGPGQLTEIEFLVQAPWNKGAKGNIDSRQHQRFLIKESCVELRSFSNSKQIFLAILDAVIAHDGAFNKADLLHRDISEGNIMMVRRRNKAGDTRDCGLLLDWDLARYRSQYKARQKERTGTWEFMSIKMLDHSFRPQDLTDDLESVFWVVLYLLIRYYPSEGPSPCPTIKEIFHDDQVIRKILKDSGKSTQFVFQGGGQGKVNVCLGYRVLEGWSLELSKVQQWVQDRCEDLRALFQRNRSLDKTFETKHARELISTLRDGKEHSIAFVEPDVQDLLFGSHVKLRESIDKLLQEQEWPTGDKSYDFVKERDVTLPRYSPIPLDTDNANLSSSSRSKRKRSLETGPFQSKASKSRQGQSASRRGRATDIAD